MIDELLVSATPFGVRTVTIDSGKVVAFNAESTRAPELLGNIYMAAEGRRAGAAHFVAIAKEQNAFLDKTGGANPGGLQKLDLAAGNASVASAAAVTRI